MTPVVILFAALVLMLLTGVVPAPGGPVSVVFLSPVFLAIAGALGVVLVLQCRKAVASLDIGSAIAHGGVALILAGAAVTYAFGVRTEIVAPVGPGNVIREVPERRAAFEGEAVPYAALGFGFVVTNFVVEFHDPRYVVYVQRKQPDGGSDYRYLRKVPVPRAGPVDLGNGERVEIHDLRDPATGEWKEQHVTASGLILQRSSTASRYSAAIRFTGAGDEVQESEIVMNRPARFDGWRFYLMDYDGGQGRHVVLSVRRDPGRPLVMAGMWMAIAGVFVMCFRRSRPSAAGAGEGSAA